MMGFLAPEEEEQGSPSPGLVARGYDVSSLFPAPPPCLAFPLSWVGEEQSREIESRPQTWPPFIPVISQFHAASPGLKLVSSCSFKLCSTGPQISFLEEVFNSPFLLELVLGNRRKNTLLH